MQILLLGLFIAIFMHDETTAVDVVRHGEVVGEAEAMPGDVWPGLGAWAVLAIALLPKLFVGVTYWIACRRTHKRLGTDRGQRALNLLEAMTSALPLLLLTLFLLDLTVGLLRTARVPLRNIVLVDEVLVMLPTLLTVVFAWAVYYPVDRRLREARIIRDADEGKAVYPLLSRTDYLSMQLRHQFGLLLLPLLAVTAWSEAIVVLGPSNQGPLNQTATMILSPIGVLIVFIGAPMIVRHVWQTRALPDGEVRDRMMALCDQHKVRVRELLLWQTSGRMINAAVTGLVSKVRYILLSDGLLDHLEPREIEAVMAHELAHVKCKHLIWIALIVVSLLMCLDVFAQIVLIELLLPLLGNVTLGAIAAQTGIDLYDSEIQSIFIAVPSLTIALLAFGWVSRRIERQADVFAARHLAMAEKDNSRYAHGQVVFDEASIETMVHALQRVSVLNHAPTTRPSWRHGSIAWRQAHLRSLIGKPLERTPVDRVLLRVKLASLPALAFTLYIYFA